MKPGRWAGRRATRICTSRGKSERVSSRPRVAEAGPASGNQLGRASEMRIGRHVARVDAEGVEVEPAAAELRRHRESITVLAKREAVTTTMPPCACTVAI